MSGSAAREIDSVIFDFDGTIADSGRVCLESAQVVLKRTDPLSNEEIERLRRLPIRQQMGALGVKLWQLPMLAEAGRKLVVARMGEVEAFEGIPEALRGVNETHNIYVHSSNDPDAIVEFMDRYDIPVPTNNIYGSSGINQKTSRLRKLLREEGLLAAQCLSVGDEIRDIKAARKVDIPIIAVGWGYILPDALKEYEPDALVATPADMVSAIQIMTAASGA